MELEPEPVEDTLATLIEEIAEVMDLLESFNYAEALDKIATMKVRLDEVGNAVSREINTEIED